MWAVDEFMTLRLPLLWLKVSIDNLAVSFYPKFTASFPPGRNYDSMIMTAGEGHVYMTARHRNSINTSPFACVKYGIESLKTNGKSKWNEKVNGGSFWQIAAESRAASEKEISFGVFPTRPEIALDKKLLKILFLLSSRLLKNYWSTPGEEIDNCHYK